jgi:chromosome partitioning protein
MRSIAIMNQKGGVGKTTTTVNLAAALVRLKHRVLVIDLDPQAHSTQHVGVEPGPNDPTIYDVLVDGRSVAEAARLVNTGDGKGMFAIIPSHPDLVGAELAIVDRPERERILQRACAAYQQEFDFCLIDCMPSLGLMVINALSLVNEVIIPLQPHFLALQGLGRLLETITHIRATLNPDLCVSGVVLCSYERGTKLAQEVERDVRDFLGSGSPGDAWHGAKLFESVIRRNIKLAEAPSFGQTIFDYAPASHGAEDYLALANELIDSRPPASLAQSLRAAGGDRNRHEDAKQLLAAGRMATMVRLDSACRVHGASVCRHTPAGVAPARRYTRDR